MPTSHSSKSLIILQRTIAFAILLFTCFGAVNAQSQYTLKADLKKAFQSPPASAKPWVFWYWMQGAVTREGITADIEAMKQSGIAGAYLMPIKDTANIAFVKPQIRQLTPEWWQMVNHAFTECKRLGVKLAFHVSDGFALAGGPWITPEKSMQKVVWTQTNIAGGRSVSEQLSQPETIEGYYKDIAVFAYPSLEGTGISTRSVVPKVTSSKPDSTVQLLVVPNNKRNFSCDDQCWIQYEFDQPFTCRTIIINKNRNNYQQNRLIVEASDDGKTFRNVTRLEPPRHGWQDWDADYTHSIPATTARYFRFIYDKSGSEPGAEDLDAAKWRPSFKINGIELSSEPTISQHEGKSGEVWRISKRTTAEQIPLNICVQKNSIIDLTSKIDKDGRLVWNAPPGKWTILRMGHTSTGHKNDTGGGGKGLECDKFDPVAIKLQFDNWFGEVFNKVKPELTSDVLKIFHVDSWECGSQNWSPVFRDEFKRRRGYDLYTYLPVMAGVPMESADTSERFLYDVRQTIAELIADNFYVTLAKLAHEKNVVFSAESVAPTMLGDGMLHYKNVDIPMGEFWLRSPTHDKPNDMLDAISGAHIYGKPVVQAEAFTELRLAWDEHPAMLKALQDRNYALGINRLVYHVFMHNPWIDRKPGMTLDGIGLFFQRDQTWWKQGKAWVDYASRCQALLQLGKPVVDVAVFTGEEIPRRAILPDRLVGVLPGIVGTNRIASEAKRLSNTGQPLRTLPAGVTHSANMADPENWINPLQGYAYDSYNADALTRLSKIRNGRVELTGGASYGLVVFPGTHKMIPNGNMMSAEVASSIQQLVNGGATVLINEEPTQTVGLNNARANDQKLSDITDALFARKAGPKAAEMYSITKVGKGRLIKGPFIAGSFDAINIPRDVIARDSANMNAENIAWTHRTGTGFDIYFISNQNDVARNIELSLRVAGRVPELWDAVTGNISTAKTWKIQKSRTTLPVHLEANGSVFIVLQQPTKLQAANAGKNWLETTPTQTINGAWTVKFNPSNGGPAAPVVFDVLSDWSKHADSAVRYYSGTASYTKSFDWKPTTGKEKVWLNVGKVANIAEVFVNGVNCGIVWTAPYTIDITKALKQGTNALAIEVTNTWANRIIGDQRLPESKRITKTNAPFRLEGKPLLEAGLLGPVVIETSK
jgi:hypothetical protein